MSGHPQDRGNRPSVLITGGAGYIGSHAVLAFREAGFEPWVVDDLSTGRLSAVPEGVGFVEADAGDSNLASLMRERGTKAVVHFAGKVRVEESMLDPLPYYEANTHATVRLLRVCRRAGVNNIVFSSTAAVYGTPETSPVSEDAVLRPISPYGRAKLAAEWAIRDASDAHGLRHAILRYFNVAGADPDGRAGAPAGSKHLLKVACEAAAGLRERVEVFGTDYDTPDGTAIRDYIHVADLAEAHVAAVRRLLGGGGSVTLNCGYGRGYSVLEVLKTAREVGGRDFEIGHSPRRAGDIPAIVSDVRRLRAALDWRPRLASLEAIVAHGLKWEREAASGVDDPTRGSARSDENKATL